MPAARPAVTPLRRRPARAGAASRRFCNDIGIDLEHGLAARRYALTGDRRALHGTVL
ncbi:hypothetical protein ACFVRD_49580 [Streptomyces sp. NPDC057908]|uniref:hypothetical protein n=1 Tax=unclassified Streptomyces TaxID=2593676 RepID=UPI0036A7561D